MKSAFGSLTLSTCLFLSPVFGHAQTASTDSLSTLMGAISQVVESNTKIAGVDEKPAKLTPPAAAAAKDLSDELQDCQTTKSTPEAVGVQKDGVSVNFKKFDLHIFGDRCPIELTAKLNAPEQTDEKLAADFNMTVVMKKQTMIDKYRMKNITVSGKVNAEAKKDGDTVTIPAHIDIGSTGESLDLGPFKQSMAMDIAMQMNTAQFAFSLMTEEHVALQYQNVDKKGYSRMKMNGFTQPETVFQINDKDVSQSEFQTFLQSFVMPGTVDQQDPNAPDARVPSSCQFVVYDKKNISADVLKTQLQSSTLQAAGKLVQGQTCGKNISVPFQKEAQAYTAQTTFGDDWISLGASKSNVYVLYGDAAPQAVESEDMVLGIQCKSVPACP